MKKIIAFIGLFCWLAGTAHAQSIQRSVRSSAGGTLAGAGSQLTFTIGETVIPTLAAGGNMLTQGFQQPGELLLAGTISGSSFCAGSTISLSYTAIDIGGGNTFTAQLSDASGSFASPVNIGSATGNASGAILAAIPPNTPAGTGYLVRVISSFPGLAAGYNNGSSLSPAANTTAIAILATDVLLIGNGETIADGDAIPSVSDHTDFGNVNNTPPLTRSFTIHNNASDPVVIGSIASSNSRFVVGNVPASVAANSSASFTLQFSPAGAGVQSATITLYYGDCGDQYDFAVRGTGVLTWYKDADDDGYSDGTTQESATQPTGYELATSLTALSGDCNDNNGAVYPGATEVCNGIDDDCDGFTDEGVQTTFYRDNDNDGQGNAAISQVACSAPSGYVANSTDCNDNDPNNTTPDRPASVSISPRQRNLCGQSTITLSVKNDPNASSYTWTLPAGFTGSSTTNSIVVSPTGTFSRAIFTVTANNACGSSQPRNATIWGTPGTPIITGPACAINPQPGLVYTVANPEPGVTYNWQLPGRVTAQSPLTGNSIIVDWARNSPAGISVVGTNACGNSARGRIQVNLCAPQIADARKIEVLVYPNPTFGETSVLLTMPEETKVALVLYDMAGKQLQRKEQVLLAGPNRIGLDLSFYPNGMYMLSIITTDGVQTVKVIKGL